MLILKAILFGGGTAASLAFGLGPAGMEAIKKSIDNGFWSGFKVSLGSIFADYFCIFLIHFGFSKIFKVSRAYEGIFFILSGIALGLFNKISNSDKLNMKKGHSNNFINGFLITIINPMNISMWLALSSTVMALWLKISTLFYYVALISMFVATASWLAILNFMAAKATSKISKKNKKTSNFASKILYYLLNLMAIAFIILGIYKMLQK